jgi:hypothetical protein
MRNHSLLLSKTTSSSSVPPFRTDTVADAERRLQSHHISMDQGEGEGMFLTRTIQNRRVGLTTDMRTSAAKRGYMVVTMHFIDDDWEMRAVVLSFVRVLYPQSADRLASSLAAAIQDLLPSLVISVWAITADNASANPAMIRELNRLIPDILNRLRKDGVPEEAIMFDEETPTLLPGSIDDPSDIQLIRCLGYVLQLGIQEALMECPAVDSAVGHFRDLVKKILDSPKLLEAFGAVCVTLKVKTTLPELDLPTRWNSTFEMLVSVILLRKPLEELLRRIRDRHDGFTNFSIDPRHQLAKEIPSIHWSAVQDFCSFLKKFAVATNVLSASTYPTLGLVIPVWQVISNHCAQQWRQHRASDPRMVVNSPHQSRRSWTRMIRSFDAAPQ